MPPAALMSSIAWVAPFLICAPKAALPPVIGPAIPILIPLPNIPCGGNSIGPGVGAEGATATDVDDGAVRGFKAEAGAVVVEGAGGGKDGELAATCFLMASMRALA